MKKALILILLVLPVVWPLFQPGFFVSDDGGWMAIRLTAFHQALVSGQFPVRFAYRLNHGYGYPIFNFAYPGGFYLGEIFYLLGLGAVGTVKLLFGLSLILTALFAFLWLKEKFSSLAAVLGSLFCIYSPYFLWDIYKRGSMGEVLAFALVPLFFWLMEKKKWCLAGLVFGWLIISHNVLALIFTPVLFLYSLFTFPSWREALRRSLPVFVLGLFLTTFFWLPAIVESKLTVLSQTVVGNPLEHLVKDLSLFGWVNLLVGFLALLLFLKKKDKVVGFFLFLFLVALFFSTPVSAPFWRVCPWSFLIQYPFRLLSLALPAAAFLTAFVFDRLFQKRRSLWFVIILAALVYFSFPFARPTEFFEKDEGFYLTNEHSTAIHNEYTPVWVEKQPTERPKEKIEVIEGEAEINALEDRGRKIKFGVEAEGTAKIRINTLYYPGWRVLVDGQPTEVDYQNEKGVIEIKVGFGSHQVVAQFGETPLRLVADLVSLASLALVGGLLIKQKKR